MTLLALSGERGAALAQFDLCRQILAAELASEPSAETTSLRLQIEQGAIAPAASAARAIEIHSRLKLVNPLPQEIGQRFVGQASKQMAIHAAIAGGGRLLG